MARNRQLSALIRVDEKVNEWPIELRYFWTMLWGYCDDYGRGKYVPKLIKADAFPLDDDVSAAKVGRWMQALELSGVICAYEVDKKRYFYCVNWTKYQRLSRPTSTDIPEPHVVAEHLHANAEQKRAEGEGKGREVEGGSKAEPPQFCSLHWVTPSTGPCPQCGDARRLHAAWVRAQKSKPTVPGIVTADYSTECPDGRHKWTADGTCAVCPSRREAVAS